MVGTLGEKYLPLHALAADLRVEITWASTAVFKTPGTQDLLPQGGAVLTGAAATLGIGSGGASITGAVDTALLDPVGTAGSGTTFPNVALYVGGTAPTGIVLQLFNVFLHCTMIQVSDDAQAAIDVSVKVLVCL
jgi:hypothetical protein